MGGAEEGKVQLKSLGAGMSRPGGQREGLWGILMELESGWGGDSGVVSLEEQEKLV